jgi:hypothetical protein
MTVGILRTGAKLNTHSYKEAFEFPVCFRACPVTPLKPVLNACSAVRVSSLDKQYGVPHELVCDWVLKIMGDIDEFG